MKRFGPWTYLANDGREPALELTGPNYWIPLREVRTHGDAARWLTQVETKRWADPLTRAHLVSALDAWLRGDLERQEAKP